MSDNFYPPPPLLKPKHYAIIAAIVVAALAGGIALGYSMAGTPPANPATAEAGPSTLPSAEASPELQRVALPDTPFAESFEEGQLLAYRLDTEIEGGGADTGQFSEVYMKFGSDVTLFTHKVDADGTADLRFVFENASLVGTFFDSPIDMTFQQPVAGSEPQAGAAPPSPQTTFLTTPVEMRVAPDGTVLDISSPRSMKDMLGSLATVPHLTFPDRELVDGMEWESELKLPVPGIGDAIDTKVLNKLVGRARMGNYDCGVVLQKIGAKRNDTSASVSGAPDEKPMLFSVPLFDLQGENTIYFDLKTGRLVHAALDLEFALRIKEQLGDAGAFLQQIIPNMAGGDSVPDLDRLLNLEGKPDLVDLSLKINGALSLVNEGTPLPLPH